ncbi:hypothetical protein [Marinibacterium sp. SX1]|uniref:hypothetical protein n=1 Tax=Marinibacterium sp. SX1 TaxID=3388424 RepID=UPI003D16F880
MGSIEDSVEITGLSRDQVVLLGDSRHLADIAAVMMGDYLMHMHRGAEAVCEMICKDMRLALGAGRVDEARVLYATLQDFLAEYPRAARGAAPA